ncbi:hypothetical protein Tcan_00397, partial [Toxocara canis]
MANLNTAFDILRLHIPTFVYEKSLKYIYFMKYELLRLPLEVVQARYGNAAREIAQKWSTIV